MPRALGSRQSAALREIVRNGPALRSTIQRATQNAGRNGSVVQELQRLSARGNSNATTTLDLMRRAGASAGGGGGGTGSSGG